MRAWNRSGSGPLSLRGQFGTEFDGGHYLVTDTSYIRKDLPQEAAQFVTLLWRWEGDSPASTAWHNTFERCFPSKRLWAMVDR